ncbi:MAG: tetratricopeptide repeat protein [Nitrospirota bacterium]
MKLDKFDIINISAAVVIAAGAVFYGMGYGSTAAADAIAAARSGRIKADPDMAPKIAAAKALMNAGQVREASKALKDLCRKDPFEASAHALLGQACSRLQDYPLAMKEYRMCLELDADYVDDKSDKFIGKGINCTLSECKPLFESELSKNPGDKQASGAIQDVHYLERMLAGGCE